MNWQQKIPPGTQSAMRSRKNAVGDGDGAMIWEPGEGEGEK